MPKTGVTPGPIKVNVVPLRVVESIPLSKVATIFWLVATLVAQLAGLVELTRGGVVSGPAPVVKVNT